MWPFFITCFGWRWKWHKQKIKWAYVRCSLSTNVFYLSHLSIQGYLLLCEIINIGVSCSLQFYPEVALTSNTCLEFFKALDPKRRRGRRREGGREEEGEKRNSLRMGWGLTSVPAFLGRFLPQPLSLWKGRELEAAPGLQTSTFLAQLQQPPWWGRPAPTFSSWNFSHRWMSLTTVTFCFSECSGSSRITCFHSLITWCSSWMSEARSRPWSELPLGWKLGKQHLPVMEERKWPPA